MRGVKLMEDHVRLLASRLEVDINYIIVVQSTFRRVGTSSEIAARHNSESKQRNNKVSFNRIRGPVL